MRILQVHNSTSIGGMEFHVGDLALGLTQKGHECTVVCPEGKISEFYKKQGLDVHNLNIKYDIDLKYTSKLRKIINQKDPQIVHAHELKAVTNTLLTKIGKNRKRKYVTHSHTPISTWKINSLKKKLNFGVYSTLVNAMSNVEIALTKSVKDVKINEGIREKKIQIIPNFVHGKKFYYSDKEREIQKTIFKEEYDIPREAFIFGNISRLTPEKGHKVLIDAFSMYKKEFPMEQNYLVIAGSGYLEASLKERAKRLGIDRNILFLGNFQDEDKTNIYNSFDTFIFPTYTEGFGLVLLEALATGLPVICSDLEVFKDIVQEPKGVLYFTTGQSEKLLEAMKLHKKSGLKEIPSDLHTRILNEFNYESFVNNYLNLYQNL